MNEKGRTSNFFVLILFSAILLYFFFKYLLFATLPIIFGWLISLLIYPIAKRISCKLHTSRKLVSGMLVISFFFILVFLAALGIRRLVLELSLFAEQIKENPEIIENALNNINESISDSKLLYGIRKITASLGEYAYIADEIINDILSSLLSSVGELLTGVARSFVMGIPTALLFIVTFILSAFYFCVDRDRIYANISSAIPSSIKNKLRAFTHGGARAASGYIKSALILMLITFVQMLFFFTVLRVKYALIISIVIAIVDVLPLLGVGAVLVPWSIYSFATSNVKMGTWLLIIFIVSTVIRNVLEPKILGKRIGVHPLLVISSAYLGFALFGGVGLILFPVIAATLSTAMKKENALSDTARKI